MKAVLMGRGMVLLTGVAALALCAPAAAEQPRGSQDQADVFPTRRFQPLPGKVVGVLVGGAEAVLALEGRRGPADALWFSTGGASYRAVYVPVPRKYVIGGLNVPVGEKGEKTRRFDKLTPASAKAVARWGVLAPCALVEVEVNGGLGGPPAETFVATHLTVLEGTREYPLHTTAVVTELRRRFRAHLKEQEEAVAQGLRSARGRMPPGYRLSAAPEQEELLYLTWLPQTQQLRAIFRERSVIKALSSVDEDLARLASPGEMPRRAGLLLGVELGMAFDVSRTGVVEQARPLAAETFLKRFTDHNLAATAH